MCIPPDGFALFRQRPAFPPPPLTNVAYGMMSAYARTVMNMTEEKIPEEWRRLNAENKDTKDGKLTRRVSEVIVVNDDNRDDVFMDIYGAERLGIVLFDEDAIANGYGEEQYRRIQGFARVDHLWLPLGDCPCKGAHCRQAWGVPFDARDLNMTGHAGSLKAREDGCDHMPATHFDEESGKFIKPVPWSANPDNWYRYQRAVWGDITEEDRKMFMEANVVTAEGRSSGDWELDE